MGKKIVGVIIVTWLFSRIFQAAFLTEASGVRESGYFSQSAGADVQGFLRAQHFTLSASNQFLNSMRNAHVYRGSYQGSNPFSVMISNGNQNSNFMVRVEWQYHGWKKSVNDSSEKAAAFSDLMFENVANYQREHGL